MSAGTIDAPVTYTEDNMKTLKDAAHIRQNPGMYIGNTNADGLHHIAYEVVYNSVDEALAGYCHNITVVVHVDGSISVMDDGRGIPVGIKVDTGKSTLEEALTVAGNSGKFDNAAYRVSAGLHGMGAKAMNALAEWCEAEVRRDGRVYHMKFERGYAVTALTDIGPAPAGVTGTTVHFKPDAEIFGAHTFDYDRLTTRVQQLAFLNKGLSITLRDERDGRGETFKTDLGIAEYVVYLNTGETVEHAPIYIHKLVDGVTVEVCLQYNNGENRLEMCFTNNAYNKDGGTHLSGFRGGLTRSLTAYGRKNGLFKDGLELKGDDFREGITVVVCLSHPDPSFNNQPKDALVTPDAEGLVGSVVYEALNEYLEKNPKDGQRICKKIALSAEARIAAKKARDAITQRKGILSGGGLPGKLMDCSTRDREKSELFLVEGDSAGGSAEGGRDRVYQAVLPLRGKVLNVEKAQMEKLLQNAEITNLITAVGVDIGNAEDKDMSKLRYGRIVILTDADVDGQHIRTLLLTFFFRQMRKLIEQGRLYVARPPLFKVTHKKEVRFVQTRETMSEELMKRGLKETTLTVAAVGERPAERTLSADELAKLLPLLADIEKAVEILERRGQSFDRFTRDRLTPAGFPQFHVHLGRGEHFFASQAEVEAFRVEQGTKLGRELAVSEVIPTAATTEAPKTAAELADERFRFTVDEWHEVKGLNKAVAKLTEFGFDPADLIPLERIAGREAPVRFRLTAGEATRELSHLRALLGEIRKSGEKGMTITRFKGLGEMNPEELWETTLDPTQRTLLRVTMNDAMQAEKYFRMLMGTEVEGRRDFILKHRANVEDIDYGA